MLITNRTYRTVAIVRCIAKHKKASAELVSKETNQSLSYCEQLIKLLRNADLVKGIRGPHGGYVLNKTVINLMDIVDLVENEKCFPVDFEIEADLSFFVSGVLITCDSA